jgi:hypothetical protein
MEGAVHRKRSSRPGSSLALRRISTALRGLASNPVVRRNSGRGTLRPQELPLNVRFWAMRRSRQRRTSISIPNLPCVQRHRQGRFAWKRAKNRVLRQWLTKATTQIQRCKTLMAHSNQPRVVLTDTRCCKRQFQQLGCEDLQFLW